MTYFIYQSLSQVERPRTQAEQRDIDRANGELVAAFAQLGHSAATPWRSLQRTLNGGRRRSPVSAHHRPRPRTDGRVVGLVPYLGEPEDCGQSRGHGSSSPNGTRELSRR